MVDSIRVKNCTADYVRIGMASVSQKVLIEVMVDSIRVKKCTADYVRIGMASVSQQVVYNLGKNEYRYTLLKFSLNGN